MAILVGSVSISLVDTLGVPVAIYRWVKNNTFNMISDPQKEIDMIFIVLRAFYAEILCFVLLCIPWVRYILCEKF